METSNDKHWASKYLLDPLNAPEPSEETGPGASFQSTLPSRSKAAASDPKSSPSVTVRSTSNSASPTPASSVRSNTNPYRKPVPSSTAYPSPPPSATTSPRNSKFPDLESTSPSNRYSQASTQIPTSTAGHNPSTVNGSNNGNPPRRRGSSLNQRHPGDQSHRPLDMLRHEAKVANRAPHLKKKHLPGADSIDVLDNVGPPGFSAYHHEGPYDATLLARNTSYNSSPVVAVSGTNNEALRATPREMVKDSISKHRPLDGTALYPPGVPDPYGRVLNYNEGANMMIEGQPEGGAYRRWDHVPYLPEDIKGKGEPSYSLEKAIKSSHTGHRRILSESQKDVLPPYSNSSTTAPSIEMTSNAGRSSQYSHRRPLSVDSGRGSGTGNEWNNQEADQSKYVGDGGDVSRTGSVGGRLRKRIGSLRGRKPT